MHSHTPMVSRQTGFLWLWFEAEVPGENTCMQKGNMQTSHKKDLAEIQTIFLWGNSANYHITMQSEIVILNMVNILQNYTKCALER